MTDAGDPLDQVTARQLLARTARAQRDGRLPSLVVAIGDGRCVRWSAGRGRVDTAGPDTRTQYRIGSITKTFTAVLVLQLRDEGMIRLTDPIDRWLPGAAALAGRSVAELLCHAGGVRAETSPPWWERAPGRSWDALLADLDTGGARDTTRGRFHYSNVGYAALGRLVAQLRCAPWTEVLTNRILHPLELHRTTDTPAPPAAHGWAVHPFSDTLVAEPGHDTAAMGPAGQLWSTVDDLSRWGRFVLGDTGDVLATDTLEEMLQPRMATGRGPGGAYGLGFEVVVAPGQHTLVGHGGSMPGFVAQLHVDRNERRTAVALANATSGLPPDLLIDLLDAVRRRHPHVVDEWVANAEPADHVADLLGVWYWGPRPYAIATTDTPDVLALTAVGTPGRDTRLDVRGPRWEARGGYFDGEPLVVCRHDDGTVSHLELASFVFTRQPYTPIDVLPGGQATHD